MPALEHSRYEAFCVARAGGAALEEAYEDAGFVPHRGHAGRLMMRPEIAERIAELRADEAKLGEATTREMITMLIARAKKAMANGDPICMREARLNLAEAYRMKRELSEDRVKERKDPSIFTGGA